MTTDLKLTSGFGTATDSTLFMNPAANPAAEYGPRQTAILSTAALAEARSIISAWPGYAATPLVALNSLAAEAKVDTLHYKDEGGRFGLGSFKALGGAYAVAQLLRAEIAARTGGEKPSIDAILNGQHKDILDTITVCCATDGNHGRSVAWGAQTFGCQCTIFIHATVSTGRRDAIAAYGAEVIRTDGNYDDSVREAQRMADENGWFVVSDTSYPGYTEVPKNVMQGYEVMAAEADEGLDEPPTHIFLQTGVGGMAAAVAAYFKRQYGDNRPKIILADPDRSACWDVSLRKGRPAVVEGTLNTMMAGLACGEVSLLAWEILKETADAVICVPDEDAIKAMRRLSVPSNRTPALVVGESAVAGLAGFMSAAAAPMARSALGLDARSRVLVFGTEGDTDPELYKLLVGKTGDAIRAGSA